MMHTGYTYTTVFGACTACVPAGTKHKFDIVEAPSTRTDPPVMGTVHAHLVLHAIHMDYIMRVHVTRWYGPTADHPGGWCKCYRGANLDTPVLEPDEDKQANGKRSREDDAVCHLL